MISGHLYNHTPSGDSHCRSVAPAPGRKALILSAGRRAKSLLHHASRIARERFNGVPEVRPNDLTPERIAALVDRDRPTILEIGCHEGTDTERLLDVMPNAHVHCFEPDPRPRARFEARWKGDRRVTLWPVAVGAESGEVPFYQSSGAPENGSGDWDYSGSVLKPKTHLEAVPWVKFETTINVPIVRLDSWWSNSGIGPIDFIWMDTQGAEADVFRGGKKALASSRFVYSEYNNSEMYEGQLDLVNLIRLLPPGFKVLERYPDDVLLHNRRAGR